MRYEIGNKEHIYLKALEIGFDSRDKGISFNELKGKLNELNYNFNDTVFRSWFYSNFDHSKILVFKENPLLEIPNSEDGKKLSLCSDALFKYLEYVELKEARANSKTAKTYSLIAILIAVASLLVSLIFSVIDNSNPQQVSEEKIQTQLKELIQENNDSQKVLDSSLFELRKLRKLNESSERKLQTE